MNKVKLLLKNNLNINYMILGKRTLVVSEKMFIDLYTKLILETVWGSDESMINFKNKLDAKNTEFMFTIQMNAEILSKCFKLTNIDEDYEKIWDSLTNKKNDYDDIKKEIVEKYQKISGNIVQKIIENLLNIYYLSRYKRNKFVLREGFILMDVDDHQYVFTINDNLNLLNLKTISYYVSNKKKYTILTLSDKFFYKYKSEIEDYENTRISGLSEVRNSFLLTYLCNNLTNTRFWDFNLTYFYRDVSNPHKVNCSIRLDWKYQFLNYSNITDFDLNLVDSDIITLWWRLSGIITVTDLKVWRFSYRCLIIRKNGVYFLNIRKAEWICYSVKDLSEKAWFDAEKYIVDPDTNDNKNVWIDIDRKSKHFDIDFPLEYKQEDIDVCFNKLMSSSKGTFWVNGKTNSWKSTTLKNILKNYYETSRNKWTNKNVMMIENPIEGYDYYLKQIEVDDEDLEDYKSIIMAIKRADLDLCVIWELRTYDVFGIFNEISNSLPVFSTFHVWTISSFLSLLKYYSDKASLNYLDVFANVNISIVQIPLEYETLPKAERTYYSTWEKDKFLEFVFSRFRLNEKDLMKEQEELKNALKKIIDLMFKNKMYPLKQYSKWSKFRLYYEILTWEMLSLFLTKKETEFWKIYDYLWYNNTILYNTFTAFLDWELLFENVKLDDYSYEVKMETLKQIFALLSKKK